MLDFNITIQPTSNDKIVKFVANQFLTDSSSYEFSNVEEAKESPISQQLFHLPFVKTVFISQNFIAIERFDTIDWEDVQEEVATAIKEYLDTGKPVVLTSKAKQKIPVSVYAESTPNPNVMKFVSNKPLVDGVFEYKSVEDSSESPLAKNLFGFPFIDTVFISSNYVSITKKEMVEWHDVVNELREFLKVYIEEQKEIIISGASQSLPKPVKTLENTLKEPTNETEAEIISILDEYIKPAVAGDGGNIAFESYDEASKTVRVILQGACSGCPSSTVTLKNGIETMLREMLQDRVQFVEAVNG